MTVGEALAGFAPSRRDIVGLLAGAFVVSGRVRAAEAIDQTAYVPLGGIEQWISIKGDNAANPVLLVVHGGPADVQWPNAGKYIPWQKAFTVVQWDQRGAGHTFGHSGGDKTPDVSLKRIAADGVELAEYLCRHLNKNKIILFGHSWGSLVGVTAVQARPGLFAAYVGSGQVESWAANVQGQFDIMLAEAKAANDTATVQMLEAIGTPDPQDTHQYFTFTRTYRSYWTKPDQDWVTHLRQQAQAMKGDKDFEDDQNGQLFTGKLVLPDQVASDLSKTATQIDTAFFVIQGREDRVAVTAAAVDYFNKVQAPYKELVLIPDAGHFAFMTADREFLAALTDKVRPVAIQRGA